MGAVACRVILRQSANMAPPTVSVPSVPSVSPTVSPSPKASSTVNEQPGIIPNASAIPTAEFLATPALTLTFGGNTYELSPKQFSTGSIGWGLNQNKIRMTVAGRVVDVGISCNITISGSKPKQNM